MDNFLNFINNHDKHFKKYNSIEDIDRSSLSGWLYIFCASAYDQDITKLFEELVDKFGKTINQLFVRMDQYEDEVNIQNIEAIHCKFASERERLLKAFLSERTPIKPVAGLEYFMGCRNLIKVLMLILVYISDEEIVMYEEFYSNKNKVEYSKLFDKIQSYLEEIRKNDEFELKIEKDIYEEVIDKSLVCQFCNTNFNSQYTLINHQKTAKYCIKLQQVQNINSISLPNTTNTTFNCEFCNKEYTLKANLKIHYLTCSLKREYNIKKEIEEKYSKEIENLKKQIEELNKFNNGENIQLFKDENLKLKIYNECLQKENNELKKEVENHKLWFRSIVEKDFHKNLN